MLPATLWKDGWKKEPNIFPKWWWLTMAKREKNTEKTKESSSYLWWQKMHFLMYMRINDSAWKVNVNIFIGFRSLKMSHHPGGSLLHPFHHALWRDPATEIPSHDYFPTLHLCKSNLFLGVWNLQVLPHTYLMIPLRSLRRCRTGFLRRGRARNLTVSSISRNEKQWKQRIKQTSLELQGNLLRAPGYLVISIVSRADRLKWWKSVFPSLSEE